VRVLGDCHVKISIYQQAKIVRKTLNPSVLLLVFNFLALKNDVNVPSKSNKQSRKNLFFWQLEGQ
jgi:hypothetical protein